MKGKGWMNGGNETNEKGVGDKKMEAREWWEEGEGMVGRRRRNGGKKAKGWAAENWRICCAVS